MTNKGKTRNIDFEQNKWHPGQSGNPKGRPKGAKTGLRARLVRILDQEAEKDTLAVLKAKGIKLKDKDNAEVIAFVLTREAIKGNIPAIKEIVDMTEIPLPRDVNLTGDFTVNIGGKDAGCL